MKRKSVSKQMGTKTKKMTKPSLKWVRRVYPPEVDFNGLERGIEFAANYRDKANRFTFSIYLVSPVGPDYKYLKERTEIELTAWADDGETPVVDTKLILPLYPEDIEPEIAQLKEKILKMTLDVLEVRTGTVRGMWEDQRGF